MKKLFPTLMLLLICSITVAQTTADDGYMLPDDTAVQHSLAHWQDLKFGLFMHWGPYSQWGVVESWSICPEDEGWTQRRGPYSSDYFTYKKAYENLQTTFNPVKFNPEKWVAAAKAAGMKYLVFTTKHHDGFCMFDTKQTDYKITSPKTPFSSNVRSNVAKEIFDAFRKENFLIGAYFSKPDWHSPDYWWPYFPPKTRNVNYDPAKYPARWQSFKDYTYNQIQELMTGYGKVNILWLDGGWVRPYTTEETKATGIFNQDVDMPRIAKMARSYQPGLIVVDRAVPGRYENYTTPEQQVPDKPIGHPWETCMTMGNSWSYVPNDHYKSVNQLVHLLVKIVSRGGNFLLNVGPDPTGDWDPVVYQRLTGLAHWIQINGEGIYASRPAAPYSAGDIYYTKAKDANILYAFLLSDSAKVTLPPVVNIDLGGVGAIKKLSLLGAKQHLKWKLNNSHVEVMIPQALQNNCGLSQSATFKIEY